MSACIADDISGQYICYRPLTGLDELYCDQYYNSAATFGPSFQPSNTVVGRKERSHLLF